MSLVVLLVAIVCMLTGAGLWIAAYRQRTEQCPPIPSFNPKNWRPVWRMQDWFTPKGYRLNLVGSFLVSLGCLFLVLAYAVWK